MHRRALLATAAALATVGLAGCSPDDGDDGGGGVYEADPPTDGTGPPTADPGPGSD